MTQIIFYPKIHQAIVIIELRYKRSLVGSHTTNFVSQTGAFGNKNL
jgi:hypothetical protein